MRMPNSLAKFLLLATIPVLLPQATAAQDDPTQAPGEHTMGLVWDEANQRWWASDRERNGVSYFADRNKGWTDFPIEFSPRLRGFATGPLAIDGTFLWMVLEGEGTAHVVKIDTSDAPPRGIVSEFEIPPAARRRNPSITGLTWDGEHLWLITACGLCSNLFKIDPVTGDEVFSVFPAANARGIAFKPNGTGYIGELWTSAYNGPNKPAHLTRRRISGSPSTIAVDQERFSFGDREDEYPEDPVAIAVRSYYFLVVDRADNQIKTYQARDLN